ncbi:hypothetical protein BD770DRAFT_228755 [Pilaira anomala]|nr:hypothetical protein BD770DRAFT_228755 [Pilaira anomala]
MAPQRRRKPTLEEVVRTLTAIRPAVPTRPAGSLFASNVRVTKYVVKQKSPRKRVKNVVDNTAASSGASVFQPSSLDDVNDNNVPFEEVPSTWSVQLQDLAERYIVSIGAHGEPKSTTISPPTKMTCSCTELKVIKSIYLYFYCGKKKNWRLLLGCIH